jgi:hypothetical protein
MNNQRSWFWSLQTPFSCRSVHPRRHELQSRAEHSKPRHAVPPPGSTPWVRFAEENDCLNAVNTRASNTTAKAPFNHGALGLEPAETHHKTAEVRSSRCPAVSGVLKRLQCTQTAAQLESRDSGVSFFTLKKTTASSRMATGGIERDLAPFIAIWRPLDGNLLKHTTRLLKCSSQLILHSIYRTTLVFQEIGRLELP